MKIKKGIINILPNPIVKRYINRQYYDKRFIKYFKELNDYEYKDLNTLEQLQLFKLKKLLVYAYNNVLYYKELFDKIEFDPETFDNFDDLCKIPILTKHIINENIDKFISNEFKKEDLSIVTTGGTTGTPMLFYLSDICLLSRKAHWARWKKFACVDYKNDKFVYIGMSGFKESQEGKKFYGEVAPGGQVLSLAAYNMDEDVLGKYIQKILEFEPVYIQGYASAVYILCKYIKEKQINIGKLHIRAVLTSSDTLFSYQRDLIEGVLGCKVFDHYGQNEDIATATECEYHIGYHINMEGNYVEIIDDEDNKLGDDVQGRIIGTHLMNYSMPLIRYDTGDIGSMTSRICGCRRKSKRIVELVGRKDDVIITPSGRNVACGSLNQPMKYLFNEVKECQYIQEKLDLIRIKIVPGENYSDETPRKLIEKLKVQIGVDVAFEFELCDKIPRTVSGKFKLIDSRIKKNEEYDTKICK